MPIDFEPAQAACGGARCGDTDAMEIKDLIIDDRQRGIFRVHRSTMTVHGHIPAGTGDDIQPMLDILGSRVRSGEPRRLPAPHSGRQTAFLRARQRRRDKNVLQYLHPPGRLDLPPRRGQRRCLAVLLSRLVVQHSWRPDWRAGTGRLRSPMEPERHGAEEAAEGGKLSGLYVRELQPGRRKTWLPTSRALGNTST